MSDICANYCAFSGLMLLVYLGASVLTAAKETPFQDNGLNPLFSIGFYLISYGVVFIPAWMIFTLFYMVFEAGEAVSNQNSESTSEEDNDKTKRE